LLLEVGFFDAHIEVQWQVHIHLRCGFDEFLHRLVEPAVFIHRLDDLLVDLFSQLHAAYPKRRKFVWEGTQCRDFRLEPFNRLGLVLSANQFFLGMLPFGDLFFEDYKKALLFTELALDFGYASLGCLTSFTEPRGLLAAKRRIDGRNQLLDSLAESVDLRDVYLQIYDVGYLEVCIDLS